MEKTKFIEKSCEIISENLGKTTAKYYREFYNDKDEKTILASLDALLSDLVGPKNAKKQLEKLTIK